MTTTRQNTGSVLNNLEEVIPNAEFWGLSSASELNNVLAILVMSGRIAAYRILPKGAFRIRWTTAVDQGLAWELIDQAQEINRKIEGGGNWQ